jgi:putative hemolysin
MNNQRFLPRLLGGRLLPEDENRPETLPTSLLYSARSSLARALLGRALPALRLLQEIGQPADQIAGQAASHASGQTIAALPVATAPALPVPLGRLGNLEVRLATTPREVKMAQKLRYRVFYDEMSAVASKRLRHAKRDADRFDEICDHLLVIDNSEPPRGLMRSRPNIVGTYRLLRQEVADQNGGFYTQGEYDIEPLIAANPHLRFLELGRSCVLKPYRDKRTVELLWHGIWSYVLAHGIDVMVGCASLAGTDPDRLALPLTFLQRMAKAPEEWHVRAHDHLRVEMDRMEGAEIDMKAAMRALPPLIKGYLRLGGHIGDGAVIDHDFGTTDVLIVLPVCNINPRYVAHYGADASRYSS